MEFLVLFTTATVAAIFAFLLFLYHFFWIRKNNRQFKRAPEAVGAWPVIGHLHLLGGPQLPHETLGYMADKYGPVFTFNLGVHQALVVSDWKIAKECFTTNDRIFANRPTSVAMEHMGYNNAAVALTPYGPLWRHVRKILALELFSKRRLDMLASVRVSKVQSSIKEIYEFWLKNKSASNRVKFEMREWFGSLILNIVVRILVGKRYSGEEEEQRRSRKAIRKFIELVCSFVVGDVIPYLRWLDLGGYEKAMKKAGKEIDYVLQGWLQEHKIKRDLSQVKDDQKDFMDVLLSTLEGSSPGDLAGFDADTVNKATIVTLLQAAGDTTMVTLTWALSLLLNNRETLKKAQDELDIHVGRERQVVESDINKLVYLQAVVKETLRLYPATPLSVPHESTEDCVVGGYNIPRGTKLWVNLWKIHRDPRVWTDPLEFRPDRFLTSHKDVEVNGNHFELIPFGSGRRMCPGISLGLLIVQFTLASLLHGFEITTPLDEPVDMTERFGITNLKATPLDVLLLPRLSSNLY